MALLPHVDVVKLGADSLAATVPPVLSATTPTQVPQLSLEPIISQQLAQTPVAANLPSHDSQDLGLYELSGLSMNSKPAKVNSTTAFDFDSLW